MQGHRVSPVAPLSTTQNRFAPHPSALGCLPQLDRSLARAAASVPQRLRPEQLRIAAPKMARRKGQVLWAALQKQLRYMVSRSRPVRSLSRRRPLHEAQKQQQEH